MADSSVPITPGTGVMVDSFTQANGDHRQAMVVGDAAAANTQAVDANGRASVLALLSGGASLSALGINATVSAYGYLRAALEPGALFGDPFDTNIDTTTRWALGGTVTPTYASGRAVVAPGVTTAGASSGLMSQPAFSRQGLNFIAAGWIANLETINATAGTAFYTGAHRFMGLGTAPATWTTTYSGTSGNGPLQDAIGYEVDTDGLMYPVVYASGVRTRPTPVNGGPSLNVGRTLADGLNHSFVIIFRGDTVFWYVDGQGAPVAIYSYSTAGFALPDVETLPLRFHTLNGSAATSGVAVLRVGAVGVGDTGNNSTQLSDGKAPWRKATIDTSGNLAVNLAGSGGLAQTTGTITAAAANTVGVASTTSTTGQVVANVAAAGNVTFHLVSAAFVGTLTFEASVDGGLNYGPIMAVREDGTGSENGTTLTVAAAFIRQYTVGIPGMTWFRVRASAYTSGAIAVVIAPGPFLIEPTPSLAASNALIGQTRDFLAGTGTRTMYTAGAVTIALTATETAASITPYRAGTAGTAGTAMTVTAGKTLRLQSFSFTVIGSATAAATAGTARIRFTNTTTAGAGSPQAEAISVNLPSVASNRGTANVTLGGDGLEIPAGWSFCLTTVGIASGSCEVLVRGYEF